MTRLLPFVAIAPLACAPAVPTENSIDLSAHGVDTWRGLTVQDERIHLVAEGRGLLEIDLDGRLVKETRTGEAGLLEMPYRDVAALESAYVLLVDSQGFLYDPQAQTETVHFCVVPGDIVGPVQVQRNDAVTISDETIVASPRFYDVDDAGNETLASSEVRTYRVNDGTPLGGVVLEEPLELQGIAVTAGGLLGVERDRVVRIDDAGAVTAAHTVDGLANAAGLATDGTRAFILDADNDRIAIVALEDL